VIEIPVQRELPPGCKALPGLPLPDGTQVGRVIEQQHAHIVALEELLKACAGG
jgi:hypothetical protein